MHPSPVTDALCSAWADLTGREPDGPRARQCPLLADCKDDGDAKQKQARFFNKDCVKRIVDNI